MKRRFRVRIIELTGKYDSPTIACDVGIRASNGELICVLDYDQWLAPGFFAFLAEGPGARHFLLPAKRPRRFRRSSGRGASAQLHDRRAGYNRLPRPDSCRAE